jgi:hypothetical protein
VRVFVTWDAAGGPLTESRSDRAAGGLVSCSRMLLYSKGEIDSEEWGVGVRGIKGAGPRAGKWGGIRARESATSKLYW